MATNEEGNELFKTDVVVIKSEPIEFSMDIKMEPPDGCNEYEDGSGNVKNGDASIKVENITVKVEPTYYSSDDELDLASYQNLMSQEQYVARDLLPILRTQVKKIRKKSDEDVDYVPKKKKKKVIKENVKKTYTTKAKKKENLYSESVTQQIELVTITEEERQIEYNDLWQNRKHMRYTCPDCAIGFVMEEPYTIHMKSHAPEAGDHQCEICRCRCRSEERLYKHRLRHYRRYRCAICRRVHKDKEAGDHQCEICRCRCRSEERLYKHRLRHYRRYRCAICRRVHKDKETAASHVMSEHVHETFTCDQCGKGFKRPAYLKKHVAQQHTKGQRHECPICARVFFHRGMFKTHFRRHNEEVRNPIKQLFICDTCCTQLKSKAALRRHLAVHAVRNLGCGLCPALFQTRRGLKLHQMNKHTDQKERMLQQCPQCDRECTTPALLRQHIRRMHTDRTKKYQCDHCKRFYYSKGEVRAHIAWSHTPSRGDRALFCCGREFRTRTRLRDHVAIHHLKVERQRIHKCDQCEKAFANKQVLNRHVKSHSNFTYPCPECGVRFKCEAYVKVHHQLKHLHMTRAQIKALKQTKTPPTHVEHIQDEPQDLSMSQELKEICFEKVVVKQEYDSDGEAPQFNFVEK